MLNSDIFNFEFVDRKSERDSVDNFLTDCQNSENVLWLSGKQGIGKSFFLTEYVKATPHKVHKLEIKHD